jgi:hypothetical protein
LGGKGKFRLKEAEVIAARKENCVIGELHDLYSHQISLGLSNNVERDGLCMWHLGMRA